VIFLGQYDSILSATELYKSPGVLEVHSWLPIEMGCRAFKKGGKDGTTLFGDKDKPFFMCGICREYWSNQKNNCCRHVQGCENAMQFRQDAEKIAREKSRLRSLKYRKKRAQEAALTHPSKKRRVTKSTNSSIPGGQPSTVTQPTIVDQEHEGAEDSSIDQRTDAASNNDAEQSDVDTDGEVKRMNVDN
jgi:hypothetical protein